MTMSESGDDPRRPLIGWLDRKQRRRELRPRDAAYLIVAVWLVAVVTFGVVEHLIDDQTFPTVWLGMWWALQTVTTVGYGDVVPRDSLGRAVASLLLLGGLALLSVVTATITSGFVTRAQRENRRDTEQELLREIRELRTQVEELSERLDR
jgi:voltage-gated potassium channel